jgi:uncharacterized membrane protein YccC
MLLEKSLFRAVGTVIGTGVGVLLVLLASDEPVMLVAGLALWLGLCAGAGNVQRGFLSYGTILAGYSAAMVALLSTGHPDQIFLLGADRLATVLVGVLVASVVGLLLAPRGAEDDVVGRTRHVLARVLREMASRVAGAKAELQEETHAILREMAAIYDRLDPHGAGSLRSRRSARTFRAVLFAQVSALLWMRSARTVPPEAEISAALSWAAEALDAMAPAQDVAGVLNQAACLYGEPSFPACRNRAGRDGAA